MLLEMMVLTLLVAISSGDSGDNLDETNGFGDCQVVEDKFCMMERTLYSSSPPPIYRFVHVGVFTKRLSKRHVYILYTCRYGIGYHKSIRESVNSPIGVKMNTLPTVL